MRKYLEDNVGRAVASIKPAFSLYRGNMKVLLAVAGLLVFLCAGVVMHNIANSEREQVETKFKEIRQMVHTHQKLLQATGVNKERLTKVESPSTTLFSRIEKLTKELQLVRRITTVRADPVNGQERVRLAVHSLQTFEAVRLFFRLERTMKNVKIIQAQIVKQKKGLAVNVLIAPVLSI